MQEDKFKVNLVIHKFGKMIYFSQLDLTLILRRALRRTNLPNYFTRGFRPHIKISFEDALKLGKKGKLAITLYFDQKLDPSKIISRLNSELPSGLVAKEINE
jgi:radical SAM-linked protein